MARQVDFRIGTEFNSYQEFRDRVESYERQEFCNYVVASSKKLVTTEDISARVVENFLFSYIRYTCKIFGDPRNTNPVNAKRQSKSYRDNCKAFFSVGLKTNNGVPVLRILNLNEQHSHERNETLFKAMPKQRRHTIDGAAPFLKQVANVKPNNLLLQTELVTSNANNQPVKRSDVKNALVKMRNTPENTNDLVKMVNAMQKIEGAIVKVVTNHQNELQGVYFQDQRMKNVFNSFPQLLLFDATFSLNDRRMPLIILLVVDGNGESQIVGLFLAKSENGDILNTLLTHFKNENPNHINTEVILTDKGHANLNVVERQFPNVAHHLCIFHVAQTFEREVTTLKREITPTERSCCLKILNNMIYCKSQAEYDALYAQLLNTRCVKVIDFILRFSYTIY